MDSTLAAMKKTYVLLSPHLDERMRRLWGPASARHRARRHHESTGRDRHVRPCITRGLKDLAAAPLSVGAVRQPGGGRKRVTEHDPALLAALDALIEPTQRGDPMRGLRWTCKSTRKLAKELTTHGHAVSHTTVAGNCTCSSTASRGIARRRRELHILTATRSSCTSMRRQARSSNAAIRSSPSIRRRKNLSGTTRIQEWAPKGTPVR